MSDSIESLGRNQQLWVTFGVVICLVIIGCILADRIFCLDAGENLIGVLGLVCYVILAVMIVYTLMHGNGLNESDTLIEVKEGKTYTLDGKQYKIGESDTLIEVKEGKTYTLDGKQYKIGESDTLIEVKEE